MVAGTGNPLATLPSVDRLLNDPAFAPVLKRYGRTQTTAQLRQTLAQIRDVVRANPISDASAHIPAATEIADAVRTDLDRHNKRTLVPVYNLTGTVLHTNLGRALLPDSAAQAMLAIATQPSNLEYEVMSGNRGDRDSHIEDLLRELTGAEAATVVNNNAAAVLLTLNTMGLGKEVPVSRGELVEIGGSFRIPEVMSRSGCQLVEVGSTNRTHLKDYEEAITGNTALLMKVHTSNYEIQGFTHAASTADVATLAHAHDLPMVTDLGSGTLIDLAPYGLPDEPTVNQAIADGADVVTFSGDKLLGGPQAGLIVGRTDLIAAIKLNPLKRALRIDKVTMAALAEVLTLYRNPDSLGDTLPSLRLLSRTPTDIFKTAEAVLPGILNALELVIPGATAQIIDAASQIGSGSMPLDLLPSHAISISAPGGDEQLRRLATAFRALPRPVIGRMHDGCLLFDIRCLEHVDDFVDQLQQLTPPP